MASLPPAITGARRWIREHPVATLLIVGGLLRLIAAIFAKGYMASDDHFVVVQVPADWLNGFPTWFENAEPIKRGVLYPYLVYALMWVLKGIGVTNPDTVMLVQRLLHGAWSLTSVWLTWALVRRFADERAAFYGGLLVAVHFIMPFMAVRNLVEVVCQPFILAGLLLAELALREGKYTGRMAFLAGLSLGLAFMFRIQTAVVPAGVFFTLLALRRWRLAGHLVLGGAVILLVEGLLDYLSFGYFLSSVLYSLYGQSQIVHEYVTGPWYTYIGTVLGVLIPPFSLLAVWWMARSAKRVPLAFWGVLLFLVIHSLIPQKQERFILPVMPAMIALAMIGWQMVPWRDTRWVRGIWAFMWVINLVLLPVGLFNYSQKARIEPLLELGARDDVQGIVVVSTERRQILPYYYARMERPEFYYVYEEAQLDTLSRFLVAEQRARDLQPPSHVILLSERDWRPYVPRLEEHLGGVTLMRHVGPSVADWLLHKMNPQFNHSKESYVFRIEPAEPVRPDSLEMPASSELNP